MTARFSGRVSGSRWSDDEAVRGVGRLSNARRPELAWMPPRAGVFTYCGHCGRAGEPADFLRVELIATGECIGICRPASGRECFARRVNSVAVHRISRQEVRDGA